LAVYPATEATERGFSHGEEAKPALPEKLRGEKTLIEFARWKTGRAEASTITIPEALKKAGIDVVEEVRGDLFLVNGSLAKLEKALPQVNHLLHDGNANARSRGGLAFHDGEFRQAIAYEDSAHKGRFLVPEAFACIVLGYPQPGNKAYDELAKKYADMPALVVHRFESHDPEHKDVGWDCLKLTPARGKTLLDVFLLVKDSVRFHYVEKKKSH
jgi:hypothetical protein